MGWTRALLEHLRSHRRAGDSTLLRHNDDVCMHAAGFVRRSQTCGTMLSILGGGNAHHYFTGTSAPCLSILKPAAADGGGWALLHEAGRPLTESLWTRHEPVHRRALFDPDLRTELRSTRDATESAMFALLGPEADTGDTGDTGTRYSAGEVTGCDG